MNSNPIELVLWLKLGFVQPPSVLSTELNLPSYNGLPGGTALSIALVANLPQQAREVSDPAFGEFAELSGPPSDETELKLDFDEPQKLETLE